MRVIIIGATSAVAQGVAQQYAQQGARLFCVARNAVKMEEVAKNLQGTCVASVCYDFNESERAQKTINQAVDVLGGIDIALIAHGALFDQLKSEQDFAVAQATLETNLLSVIAFLIPLAQQMGKQKSGKIGVITSVAGERGRPRNYTYGTAKGALNIYLQGLRSVLYDHGVEIYTFKLGPVDTPMTVDHPKNFSFATVEQVATKIVYAFKKKRYELYVPSFWRVVMFFVRIMPEWLFQRLEFLSGR